MSKNEMIEIETRKLELETSKFELEQRRAKALSVSAFFPDTLKGDIASAVIVYDLAQRMNISVMEVAQSIYIIHGRPSFSTNFLVARLNQSGLIKGALKTVVSEDGQSAYCTAIDAETGETLKGMTVTMEMARKEGWLTKKGSKWQTMPELMLRKRAQSFFIKEFYPQVMFGMQTAEEVEDIEAIPVEVENETRAKADINAAIIGKKPEPETSSSPEPQPEQPQEEAPKQKRVPRYISKHYPTLEALGLKKHDARKFVDYMDWMEQPQEMIDGFFSQDESEIKRYINAFYGIGEPEEPDYTEAEVEEPEPETEPDDVMPEPQEDKAPAAVAGGFDISNAVVAQYPQFIKLGLKGQDCFPFAKWAGLNGDNIDEFMADLGGVQALIEQFYAEAGYAE